MILAITGNIRLVIAYWKRPVQLQPAEHINNIDSHTIVIDTNLRKAVKRKSMDVYMIIENLLTFNVECCS